MAARTTAPRWRHKIVTLSNIIYLSGSILDISLHCFSNMNKFEKKILCKGDLPSSPMQ